MQTKLEKDWNGFWSLSTIALLLAWLYATAYAVFLPVSVLQLGAGTWDVSDYLFLGAFFVPGVLIPFLLIRSFRKRRRLRLSKILPWVFRVMYISIIFALCDCLSATTRGQTIFSMRTASPSGERAFIGFGYELSYSYGYYGSHFGPTIWFWFTPFVVDLGHKHSQIYWVWKGVGDN